MIAHWDVFMEFWFHSIAPTSGIELNGLFGPNSRPFPFFFVGFFFPVPTFLFHDPIKGGGCHTPILGAPLPSLGGGVGAPILGAPFPVKAFNTSWPTIPPREAARGEKHPCDVNAK